MTARVGVLGGVGEQVHDDLFQPGRVGVHPDRFRRQRHRQFMLALVDQRADRRHGIFHHDAQGDRFLVKLNPTCGDARDFEQFINDLCQLSHLTLNDGGGLLKDWVLDAVQTIPVAVQAQEKSGIEDGGKRVAKFMAEHRQELIFAAVQVGERRRLLLRQSLEAAAFRDVTDVALNDLVLALLIDIADEFDLDLLSRFCFPGADARSGRSPSLAVPGKRPGSR